MDRGGRRNINILRILFAVLGIVFVALGLMGGEHITVLGKAVRVCLECIGIG